MTESESEPEGLLQDFFRSASVQLTDAGYDPTKHELHAELNEDETEIVFSWEEK